MSYKIQLHNIKHRVFEYPFRNIYVHIHKHWFDLSTDHFVFKLDPINNIKKFLQNKFNKSK
jgi:hypothetical protein